MAIQFKAGAIEAPKAFFVPAGPYKLRVIEGKEDSSTNGNDMINVKFRVILKDGTDGPAFRENLVFTAKAFWKIDQFLKSCGKHPGEGEEISIDVRDIVGWECEANLTVRNYTTTSGAQQKANEIGSFIWDDGGF